MTETKLLLLILIFISFLAMASTKIAAQLYLLTYQPLKLNLTFSQTIQIPKFQLLFNQNNIPYTTDPPTGQSTSYTIVGDLNNLSNFKEVLTQNYKIVFTEPLRVADRGLSLDSFVIRAQRQTYQPNSQSQHLFPYFLQQPNQILQAASKLTIFIVYLLSFSTVIGLHFYNFITIFMYISIQSQIFTTLDYKCAFYLFFQIDQIIDRNSYQIVYLVLPYIVLVIAFAVGGLVRGFGGKWRDRGGVGKEVYYYFAYRLAIIVWEIICVPLLVNIIHLTKHTEQFTLLPPQFHYPYLYFSTLTIALYSYTSYITTNPQPNQPLQSYISYTKSPHFKLFYGFHLDIDSKNWKTRNLNFLVSIFRNIVIIFIGIGFKDIPNLIVQILYLVYLFVFRPFKLGFFNFCVIGVQVFVILFYLWRFLVLLYMNIGEEIVTSKDFGHVLLASVVWLSVIVFTYFGLGIYELTRRIKQIRLQITQSRRQNSIQKLPSTLAAAPTIRINLLNSAQPQQKRMHSKSQPQQQFQLIQIKRSKSIPKQSRKDTYEKSIKGVSIEGSREGESGESQRMKWGKDKGKQKDKEKDKDKDKGKDKGKQKDILILQKYKQKQQVSQHSQTKIRKTKRSKQKQKSSLLQQISLEH